MTGHFNTTNVRAMHVNLPSQRINENSISGEMRQLQTLWSIPQQDQKRKFPFLQVREYSHIMAMSPQVREYFPLMRVSPQVREYFPLMRVSPQVREYMKQKRIAARRQRQQESEEKRREQERIALNKQRVQQEAKSAVTETQRKKPSKHKVCACVRACVRACARARAV